MDREEIREIISKVFLKHYADIFVHACTHTFKSQHHTSAEILESQYIFFHIRNKINMSVSQSWFQLTLRNRFSYSKQKGPYGRIDYKIVGRAGGASSRLSFQVCFLEHQPRTVLPRAAATVVILK